MKWYWKINKLKRKSAPSNHAENEPVTENSSTIVQSTAMDVNTDNLAEGKPSVIPIHEVASTTGIKIASLPLVSIADKRCIKANLIKTNKKDVLGNPRYENLDIISEKDTVKLEYIEDTKTYLVLDVRGNELGEIGSETSLKILKSYENNICASIDSITESVEGNYSVLIKVYVKK